MSGAKEMRCCSLAYVEDDDGDRRTVGVAVSRTVHTGVALTACKGLSSMGSQLAPNLLRLCKIFKIRLQSSKELFY